MGDVLLVAVRSDVLDPEGVLLFVLVMVAVREFELVAVAVGDGCLEEVTLSDRLRVLDAVELSEGSDVGLKDAVPELLSVGVDDGESKSQLACTTPASLLSVGTNVALAADSVACWASPTAMQLRTNVRIVRLVQGAGYSNGLVTAELDTKCRFFKN